MIAWPLSLVAEIAERRCVIVIGAGVSAGCLALDGVTRPPDWKRLLNDLADLLSAASCRLVKDLVETGRLLDAAEIAVQECNAADYSAFMRSKLSDPNYQVCELQAAIHKLDAKVVISTNYDQIYDKYCGSDSGQQGYTVCKYSESHMVDDLRSTVRLIAKPHGCISNPQEAVLSRTQYYKARRDHKGFFSVIESLILTNTVLFVGCGMSDPDFLLMLENVNMIFMSRHHHYAVVESGQPEALKRSMMEVHNVKCLEFPAGEYNVCLDSIHDLVDKVESWRRTHS